MNRRDFFEMSYVAISACVFGCGIASRREHRSPNFTFRTDGAKATRKGKIAWSEIQDFLPGMVPVSSFFG